MNHRIAYVPGVFDLLHEGHLNVLQRARAIADQLIVGVVSDAGAFEYKRAPVQSQGTRLAVIRALRIVDFAVLQQSTDPTRELKAIRPDLLVHGNDWKRLLQGQDTLNRLGIEFVLVPYTDGISTSDLIARMVS